MGADTSHHVTTGLYFRKLTFSWFSASDGPPEPCWYCLRTQESGSQPETGQQVFSCFALLTIMISEVMILEYSISNYVVRKQKLLLIAL